ncbi:hypothetical protein CCR75_007263 [Bremia lactucae]|uniref:Uncharacterized protein n=1 Tax=Bremia lactucae TaxID=4779 RepID=A0A976IH65_BRELC|nr:hypothetical protein CCR75_007263 [Bremia lactucae]
MKRVAVVSVTALVGLFSAAVCIISVNKVVVADGMSSDLSILLYPSAVQSPSPSVKRFLKETPEEKKTSSKHHFRKEKLNPLKDTKKTKTSTSAKPRKNWIMRKAALFSQWIQEWLVRILNFLGLRPNKGGKALALYKWFEIKMNFKRLKNAMKWFRGGLPL